MKGEYASLSSSTVPHSTSGARRWRFLLSFLLVVALVGSARSQLLFPANQQIPFYRHPSHYSTTNQTPAGARWKASATTPPRIAVIGAGAGGSSAAFFLSHFRNLANESLASEVTVFDKASYIGGRSTVVWPWADDPYSPPDLANTDNEDEDEPVELGASIFVGANRNLMKAARVFGLDLSPHGGEDGTMSIWDGEKFVYVESGGRWGYWDIAKMLWRYGRSPLLAQSLVKKTVASFVSLYSREFASYGPFDSLSSFAALTNLSFPASVTSKMYFTSANSISPLFTNELIAAATAVNYGTPAGTIHGLGALVSLAAQGASKVVGGNRRIFEGFMGESGAKLRLGGGGEVMKITKLDKAEGGRAKWVVQTKEGAGGTFDAVILAAPFHQTSVSFINTPLPSVIPAQPYVPLHVTFVLTNASSPSPSYFSLPPRTKIATSIFATFDTTSSTKPSFNSLNYLQSLSPSVSSKFGEGTFHVVKMFSAEPLSTEFLESVFGEGNVGKAWSKLWEAYPLLKPVEAEEELAPVRPDEGFYYVNGFERLISTMETETVSAFNVVSLLLNDFYGYQSPSSWAEWDEE
ncbi:prenylcysteine oxidase [Pseudohyphozyma bogoriensis]|nr:prenylcysteine oxidase [Pseudohyphozyma bogoriensis]